MGLDWARTSRADGYVRACDGYGDQRDREGDDDDDGGDLPLLKLYTLQRLPAGDRADVVVQFPCTRTEAYVQAG